MLAELWSVLPEVTLSNQLPPLGFEMMLVEE